MKTRQNGIVLISILVLTLLATFFIGALVQMNPTRLRRTVHDESRDRAAMAARAGVDYALNRLKSDTDWKAERTENVVQTDDLVIREDRGNVLGWIRAEDGNWAGFRFRFNHQDGPIPRDADPALDRYNDPDYPVFSPEISLNNLSSANDRPIPIGDGPSFRPVGNTGLTVPRNTVALIVEGIVSPDLDPSNPASLSQAQGATVRTLEGIYTISEIAEMPGGDAVLMAGGDASVIVGNRPGNSATARDVRGVLSLQSDDQNVAGIRVKGKMTLDRGQNGGSQPMFDPDEDAQVLVNERASFSAQTVAGDTFVGGTEQADDPFLKVEWDRVKDSDQSDPIQIPAGVYIFSGGDRDSGRSVANSVGYYEMTWQEYRNRKMGKEGTQPLPPPSPVPQEFADRLQLDGKDVTSTKIVNGSEVQVTEKRDVIVFEKDIEVVRAGGIDDLAIIPERGARQKAGVDPVQDESVVDTGIPEEPDLDYATGQLSDRVFVNIESAGGSYFNGTMSVMHPLGSVSFSTSSGTGTLSGSPGAVIGLFQQAAAGTPFEVTVAVPQSPRDQAIVLARMERSMPGADFEIVTRDVAGVSIAEGIRVIPTNPGQFLGGGGGGNSSVAATDELHIPKDETPGGAGADATVPQDIEIVFQPGEDADSAFIRSDGDIFLGTHLSGKGGGVVAKGDIDIVGYGVKLQSLAQNSQKDGIAIYGKNDINISTYDERRNKYWDVNLFGSVFTEGNLHVRQGESPLGDGREDPQWGIFNYEGVIISLGEADAVEVEYSPPDVPDPLTPSYETGTTDGTDPRSYESGNGGVIQAVTGNTTMIASGLRLFYDPRYLAPYVETEKLSPTFTPLSVVMR
jgi:hypothetical protein